MIHREALASKTLPDVLKCVFQVCIKIVNYIKSSALNTRVFQNLCLDIDAHTKRSCTTQKFVGCQRKCTLASYRFTRRS